MKQAVSPQMRQSLLRNRTGRLTVGQWKTIITEPLAMLLLLAFPAVLILGPRLSVFGLWVWLLFGGLILIPILMRGWRYARIPLRFVTLYAGDMPSGWMFWKPLVMHTASGEPITFKKRLTPRFTLDRDRAYIVYYAADPSGNILLSLAPASSPDVEKWYPTEKFLRRGGQQPE